MGKKTIVSMLILACLVLMGTSAFATWQYANTFNLMPPYSPSVYGDEIPGWYTTDYSRVDSWGAPRSSRYLRYVDPTDDFNPLDSDAAFMRFDLLSTASDNYWIGVTVTLYGSPDFDPNHDLLPISRARAQARYPDSAYVGGPDIHTMMGLQFYEEQGMAAGSNVNTFDDIDLRDHPEAYRDMVTLCNPATEICTTIYADDQWYEVSAPVGIPNPYPTWKWWQATILFESYLMDRDMLDIPSYGLPFLRYWMILRAEGCHSRIDIGDNFWFNVPCMTDGYVIEGMSNLDTFYVNIVAKEHLIVYKINPAEVAPVSMADAHTDCYILRNFDIPDTTLPGWGSDPDRGRWARSEEIIGWDKLKPQIRELYPRNVVLSNGPYTDCQDDPDDMIFTADSTQPISFKIRDVQTCVESVMVIIEYINPPLFPEYHDPWLQTRIYFRNKPTLPYDQFNSGPSAGWEWKYRYWNSPTNWTEPVGWGTWPECMVYPLGCTNLEHCCTDSFVIENGMQMAGDSDDFLNCFIDGANVRVTINTWNRTTHADWPWSSYSTLEGWYADTTWQFRVDLSGPNAELICPEADGHDNDTEEFSGINRRSETIERELVYYRWLADSLPTLEIEVYDDYDRVHDRTNHGLYYTGHVDGAGINKRDFIVQFDIYACCESTFSRTLYVDEDDIITGGVYIDECYGECYYRSTMWVNFEELFLYDPDFGSDWELQSGDVVYVILTSLFDDPDYGQSDESYYGVLPPRADLVPSDSWCATGGMDPNYGTDNDRDNHVTLESGPLACPGYTQYSPDTLGIVRIDLKGPTAPDTTFYPPRQWVSSDSFQVITVDIYDQLDCPNVDSNFANLYNCVAGVYTGSDPDDRLVMNIKVRGCDGTWHPSYIDYPSRPWEGRNFIWTGPGDDWMDLEKVEGEWGVRVTFDPYRRFPSNMRFRAGDKICVTVYVWDNAYNDCHPDNFEIECEDESWLVDVFVPGRNHAIDTRDPDFLYPIQRQVARWSFFIDIHAPVLIDAQPGGPCCDPWYFDLKDISDRVGAIWCDEWVAGVEAADIRLIFLDSLHGGNPYNAVPDTICWTNVTYGSWMLGEHVDREQYRYATLDYGGPLGLDPTREARLSLNCWDSMNTECHFFQPGDVVQVEIWAGDGVNVPWYPATEDPFGYGYRWYHLNDTYANTPTTSWRRDIHNYFIGPDSLLHWDSSCYDYWRHIYMDYVNPNWALVYVDTIQIQGETYIQSVDWFNDEAYTDWAMARPYGYPQDLHGMYDYIYALPYPELEGISMIHSRDDYVDKFAKDLNFMWVAMVTCVDSFILECVEDTFHDTLTERAPFVNLELWDAMGDLVWDYTDYYNCHCSPCFLEYYPDRYRCYDYGYFRIGPLDQMHQWLDSYRDYDTTWIGETMVIDTIIGYQHRDSLVVTLGIHVKTPNQFNTPYTTYKEFRWDYIIDMLPPTGRFATLEGLYGYEEVNCIERHADNNAVRVRLENIRDADVGCSGNTTTPMGWNTVWPLPSVVQGSDWLVYEMGTWANAELMLTYNYGTYYLYTNEHLSIYNCAPEEIPGRHHAVGPITMYTGLEYSVEGTTAVLNTLEEDTIFIADTIHAEAIIQDRLGNQCYLYSPQMILDNGLPEVKGLAFSTYQYEECTYDTTYDSLGGMTIEPSCVVVDEFTDWDPRYCWLPWDPGHAQQDSLIGIYNFGDVCTIYVRLWFDDNMDMRAADASYGYIVRFRPEGWTHWFPVIPIETHAGFYPLSDQYVNYDHGIMAPRMFPDEGLGEMGSVSEEAEAMFLDNGWNTDREWIGYMIIAGDGVMDGVATLRVSGFDDNAANIMTTRDFPFRIETNYYYPDICWPAVDSSDRAHTDPWASPPYDDRLVITGRSGELCVWACDTIDPRNYDISSFNYDIAITDSVVWYLYWHDEEWTEIPASAVSAFHYVIDNPRESCQILPAAVYDVLHQYNTQEKYLTVEFRVYSRFYHEEYLDDILLNVMVDNESPCGQVDFDTIAGGDIPPGIGLTIIPKSTDEVRIVLSGDGVSDVDYVLYYYLDLLTGDHYSIYPEGAHLSSGYCSYVPVGAYPSNPYYDPVNDVIIYDWDWTTNGLTPGLYSIKTRGYDLINNQYGECTSEGDCYMTDYETYYQTFSTVMESVLVPYEVLFARGDDFYDATLSTFGDLYPWDEDMCLPDWPGWVNGELDGIVDAFPYLERFPITTFSNPDYTSGPEDPLLHPYVETGGYPGDSLYVMFMDVGADSIRMIIEDEFGGNISGSNLRIELLFTPDDLVMNPCDEMYYYVYNWIVDDMDNRYDGPVRVTVTLYFWNEFYSEHTITNHVSYILLDTYDPYYVTALARTEVGDPLMDCRHDDLPDEKIWVTNADEIDINVYWHETVFDQEESSEGFVDYDPTGRNWSHLRLTIDGQPNPGFNTDDPNDALETRLWHSRVFDGTLPAMGAWIPPAFFDDISYIYTWTVANDVRGNGLTKIKVKGRDVAGNILDYDEAMSSISEGKWVLVDVTYPVVLDEELIYATEVSFSADAGAIYDNFIDAGFYDPVGGGYVYVDLDTNGVFVQRVWVNEDGSITPVVVGFTDGQTVHMTICDLAGNCIEANVVVAPHLTCCVYEFCPGWNFISLPRMLEDATIEANFPADVDIYSMDASGLFVGPLDRDTELDYRLGYVAFSPDYATVTVCGRCVEEWAIPIVAGWNLVGSLCEPIPFVTPDTDPAGIIEPDNVFWYDACIDAYIQVEELTPCAAHLVLAAAPGTLYVPARGRVVHTIMKSAAVKPLWNSPISIEGKGFAKDLTIGVGEGATEGYDRGADRISLPAMPDRPDVSLDQSLLHSVKAPDNVITWDLNVRGEFNLVANDLPEGYTFFLQRDDQRNDLSTPVAITSGTYKLVAVKAIIPDSYTLAQNHPNPFNATTTISFGLPEDANVTLEVYNVLGDKVVTLLNGEETAGFKTVMWNGRDAADNSVATGIYFYQLKTDKFSSIKKMILMK
ncbi:T9SS type A sorting domain-containing protein [bacterium]|nr:T9SS type A sorting domain-containing protein [bacterium]